MDEDITTILSDFGKKFHNDEVSDRMENLKSVYGCNSETIINSLLIYLNSNDLTNPVISMEMIDKFERESIGILNKEIIKFTDNKSSTDIQNIPKIDFGFVGQYSEKVIADKIATNTTEVTVKESSYQFENVKWPVDICNIKSNYEFFFQKNSDVLDAIEKQSLYVCKNQLKLWSEKNPNDVINFDDLCPLRTIHQEEMYSYGRIAKDHNQAVFNPENFNSIQLDDEFLIDDGFLNNFEVLNNETIALQGYSSDNKPILESLILSHINSYSFFPGQNVIVKGKNISKSEFIVSSVLDPLINDTLIIDSDDILGDLNVVVACGPFVTSDCLALQSLLHEIRINKCHVLILLGPIIDINNCTAQKNGDESFYDMYLNQLLIVANACVELDTHLIFVPSLDDPAELPVFPQQCFTIPDGYPILTNPLIHFAPNPAIVKIGPYLFGLSSVDILRHLCKHEINKNLPAKRINRLYNHILAESNFYPLKPAHSEINVDWTQWYSNCQMGPSSPHIIIMPSSLNTTKEVVNNVVCINPGYIKKDNHRSSYCRINISESKFKSNEIVDMIDCKFVGI